MANSTSILRIPSPSWFDSLRVWSYGDHLDDVVIVGLENGSWSVRAASKNGGDAVGTYVVEDVGGAFRCICPAACLRVGNCPHIDELFEHGIVPDEPAKMEQMLLLSFDGNDVGGDR